MNIPVCLLFGRLFFKMTTSEFCTTSEPVLFSSENQFWSLGLPNSKLSYYDGLIQLTYKNGTAYNDEKKTQRSTLITFLCDRQAGVGQPEYQVRSSI